MGSTSVAFTALLLSFNLLFFTLVSSTSCPSPPLNPEHCSCNDQSPPPPHVPGYPSSPPPSPKVPPPPYPSYSSPPPPPTPHVASPPPPTPSYSSPPPPTPHVASPPPPTPSYSSPPPPTPHPSYPSPPPPSPPTPTPSYPSPPPPTPSYPSPPPPTPIYSSPPPPSPKPCPPTTPSSSPTKCPKDTLKLGVCVDLLKGLLGIVIGQPPTTPCCSLIGDLVDLEAAVCLCTTIKASLLGINLNLPINLSLVLNHCGKNVPQGFQCP
ncbi:pEARLI1-like lipid transfer protein 2 [Mercurialis annua]|uniref:pEARLI1-like lipid transfer protein 2 n=1 Tax=Mercurialis annua TaxID=3986 RepID=UPI00215F8F31|nr:pEARLI1-like lipid transfer protein 2 [Mercurialis annua]